MRAFNFGKRCFKEVLRDPLTICFGIVLPVALALLLSAIQARIPAKMFTPEKLTPGIVVFSYSFLTLFSASVVAKDRKTALFQRLYTTPMKAGDFILGYTVPYLPIALIQTAVVVCVFAIIGLPLTWRVALFVLLSLPAAIFFIFLGLLCGSVMTPSQVGGICGSVVTNLSAWLSGAWFDVELVGGPFKAVSEALPFYHAVELGRGVLSGSYDGLTLRLTVVLAYALAAGVLAVVLFTRQMKKQ